MMAIFDQTCENSCERVAFQIEIRRLKKSVEDWHDRAVRAERREEQLCTEIDALKKCCTQRGARMQIMRDWMASCSAQDDWRQFVFRNPSAENWFDSDGVPVRDGVE